MLPTSAEPHYRYDLVFQCRTCPSTLFKTEIYPNLNANVLSNGYSVECGNCQAVRTYSGVAATHITESCISLRGLREHRRILRLPQ